MRNGVGLDEGWRKIGLEKERKRMNKKRKVVVRNEEEKVHPPPSDI